ncbi:hypothetical protein H0B56_06310 [Haloechinothrix sp. YIM 98757]|uniref:DUF4352 domain-containing protein n=1 Tax=Haloechinothrix aidingensis TaxID=2752311 RepID=A0A838A5U4_9PSEU|nr:hypothetical protein [Haloechinothrix aidingensis]MBA0125150.1 hypothetical protein [Haloechinothrix aidingensis]
MRAPRARHRTTILLCAAALTCVAPVAVGGCASPATGESAGAGSASEPVPGMRAHNTDLEFGQRSTFDNGVAVRVAGPRTFTPSDAAYPSSDSAVAFEISLRNGSDTPYQLSQLAVSATMAGAELREIVDPRQGFTGFAGAGDDLPSGRSTHVTVAFAAADGEAAVSLTVQVDPDLHTARFTGR